MTYLHNYILQHASSHISTLRCSLGMDLGAQHGAWSLVAPVCTHFLRKLLGTEACVVFCRRALDLNGKLSSDATWKEEDWV